MDIIKKHWRGEIPLVYAFWENVFCSTLILAIPFFLLGLIAVLMTSFVSPKLGALFTFSIYLLVIMVIIWQVVGLWRSSTQHVQLTHKPLWGNVVKGFIILYLGALLLGFISQHKILHALYNIVLVENSMIPQNYGIGNTEHLITLQGPLKDGSATAVKQILEQNPDIKTLVLNSSGGSAKEVYQLAYLVYYYELNTYSEVGCSNNCIEVFIAGKQRGLGMDAHLGFQHPTGGPHEIEKEVHIFKSQGISETFINEYRNKMQISKIWYPAKSFLIKSNVVDGQFSP